MCRKGFAHGFITLADDTEAFYFVDEFYSPEYERGVRYDDPKFNLQWPIAPVVVSDKDKTHRDFDPVWHLGASLMKILFSGGSSFTGYWFIRELVAHGHDVVAIFRQGPDDYPDDSRRRRVGLLSAICRRVFGTAFGDDQFLTLIKEGGWDLLCHHGADVTNYKSADFDIAAAVANNTHRLPMVLDALINGGCRKIILTGSVFENDEGAGSEDLRAFSPYALSKGFTWQLFRYHAQLRQMTLGKFVIANPFGPCCCSPRPATRSSAAVGDGPVARRGGRSSTGPTSASSTCGCLPTYTDEGLRAGVDGCVRPGPPSASSCSRSTWRSATRPSCSSGRHRWRRLPVEGPGGRCRRLHRRGPAGGRRRRYRARPRSRGPAPHARVGRDPIDRGLIPREREVS